MERISPVSTREVKLMKAVSQENSFQMTKPTTQPTDKPQKKQSMTNVIIPSYEIKEMKKNSLSPYGHM